ncbi:unnamed protein product, partial [Effrenium voratum]
RQRGESQHRGVSDPEPHHWVYLQRGGEGLKVGRGQLLDLQNLPGAGAHLETRLHQ